MRARLDCGRRHSRNNGDTMNGSIVTLSLLLIASSIVRADSVFETDILKDEVGFKGSDGSKVSHAINMMGIKDRDTGETKWQWRLLLVDLPIETTNVAKVEAFLPNGEPLEFGEDPNFWEGYKFVKLWIVREQGFEFKVRITFKE